MEILFFCPRWGSESLSWSDFYNKVKTSGYAGVEMSLPLDVEEKKEILKKLKEYDLVFIAQHWETIDTDFDLHKKNFEKRLRNLASANPLFINSQTGKDYFSVVQNRELMEIANNISQETGIKIVHETHRGKWSFAAHITRHYLESFNDIRLTLDISHWCNTAESYLQDQKEAVDLAIFHTDHIHARIGFPQGPQINDPRAPEWQETVFKYLSWWDKIIDLKIKEKNRYMYITPEFGPDPYMPLLPFTRQPVTNQWEINQYMMELLKERYIDLDR